MSNGRKWDGMASEISRETESSKNTLYGRGKYIATDDGWLYLAEILDLYSRDPVGRAMADRMTKDLVILLFLIKIGANKLPQAALP